jgi:ribonuclease HI
MVKQIVEANIRKNLRRSHEIQPTITMTADLSNSENDSGTPEATLQFDGASRGNPGPAAYGYVLTTPSYTVTGSGRFGETTNNRAEYAAVIAGLQRAYQEGCTEVHVQGDSQLVIRQLTGEYEVNADRLKPYHQWATTLAENFESTVFTWIERDQNTQADQLAESAFRND